MPNATPAYFDSQESAASILHLPMDEIRQAKREGCPAFRSGRVYREPLIEWFATKRAERANLKAEPRPNHKTTPHAEALCSLIFAAWETFLIPGISDAECDEIRRKMISMVEKIAAGSDGAEMVKWYGEQAALYPVPWRLFVSETVAKELLSAAEPPLVLIPEHPPQARALCLLISQAWECIRFHEMTREQLNEIISKTVLTFGPVADEWGVGRGVTEYVSALAKAIQAGPVRRVR